METTQNRGGATEMGRGTPAPENTTGEDRQGDTNKTGLSGKLDLERPRGAKSRYLLELGQLIREKRKARKLALEELSTKAGVNYSNLSQIENGKVNVSVETLLRISRALECTLEIKLTLQ